MLLNRFQESSDKYSPKSFERTDIKKWSIFCSLSDEFINTINIMAVFGRMGEKALVITETDDVYTIGRSDGFSMNVLYDSTVFQPKHRPELSHKGLKGFAFTHNICLAYNEFGKLFWWENNSSIFGAMWNKKQITDLSSSCKELSSKSVTDVVYSTTHGLILCSDGEVFAIRKEPDTDCDNKNTEIFSRNILNCNEDQKITNVSSGSGAPPFDSSSKNVCSGLKHASVLKAFKNANETENSKRPSSTGVPVTANSSSRFTFTPKVSVPTTFSFSSVTTNAFAITGTSVTNTTNGIPVFSGTCELSSTPQLDRIANTTPEIKVENVIKEKVFAIRKEPDSDCDNKNTEIFSRNNLNCNEDQKVTNVSSGYGACLFDSSSKNVCSGLKHASVLKAFKNANETKNSKKPSSTEVPVTANGSSCFTFTPSVTTNAFAIPGTSVTNTTNGIPVFSGTCERSSTAQLDTIANTTPEIKVENVIKGKVAVGIACTDNVSFILLDNGEVLSCSLNENGGKESNALCSLTPVESLSGIYIKKLVCGFSYVMALNELGQVFTWSVNNENVNGELGRISKDFRKPAMVSKLNNIVDVAAVKYCRISVALDSSYKIYVWGLCNGQNVREPMLTHFYSLHDVFAQLASPSVTCTFLNAKCTKELTLLDDIKNAFDKEDTADVTISVEDTKIKAHKAILKIRCSHFKNLMEDVDENGVLTINGHKHAVYATFLKYLYTGEINISEESVFDLFELAREYQEVKVQNKCIQIMKLSVSVKTVIPIYLKGIERSKELEHFCLEFIMNNLNEVVNGDSFKQLDHCLIKNIFVEVARRRLFKT